MALSPMMEHYLQTKDKYKDCVLFYRLGDFYEMFSTMPFGYRNCWI